MGFDALAQGILTLIIILKVVEVLSGSCHVLGLHHLVHRDRWLLSIALNRNVRVGLLWYLVRILPRLDAWELRQVDTMPVCVVIYLREVLESPLSLVLLKHHVEEVGNE